jgi:glycosyltransferase involved in cell wall biosynthesis
LGAVRVLHIDTEMTWRGGENQLRLLVEGLARRGGFETHLALRPGSAALQRLGGHAPTLALPMRGGFDPAAALKLRAYCRRHAIDVIDAHTANAHALSLLAKSVGKGPRLVVHRRVDNVPRASLVNRRKYLSPSVDRYVAISGAIRDVLVRYGVPTARVEVVRSAIDGSAYATLDRAAERAALARAFGVDPALPLLGNASALSPQKGYETLLGALARLKERGVAYHAFVAGDGELRDELERRRIRLGLEHHVTFLGFVADVPRLLSALDVLAMPSNWEGLGTLLLEATSAGLAIAATRVGGIPEVVAHEETGLLSAAGDVEAHAENLARLCADAALRARLNAAARERVTREFSVASMVSGNAAVYRAVVEGGT